MKAVSEGKRRFKAMAVCGATESQLNNVSGNPGTQKFVWPCGICRQFMAEFGDMPVISVLVGDFSTAAPYEIKSLRELLPDAFTPSDLLSANEINE